MLADRSLSRLLGADWPRTLHELEALTTQGGKNYCFPSAVPLSFWYPALSVPLLFAIGSRGG